MRAIEIPVRFPRLPVEPGPAPMLQWLPIADLVVDDSYQRDLKPGNWNAIRRIAQQFRWSRFSPVFVAPVEGGRYAIIDGQHRTHAAAMCGHEQVPCQIVQMDHAEQAASFAAVNGLVTKVTPWQVFKAALAAGTPWAVACAKACSDAGCRLMTGNSPTDDKKAGEIYALALVRGHVGAGRADMLTFALAGLRRSEGGAEPAVWSNELLKPLLAAIVERPWLKVQDADLAGFLDRFDIWAAIDRAEALARDRRRQGAVGVSRYDLAAAQIGEALDRTFPQRMALPKGGE